MVASGIQAPQAGSMCREQNIHDQADERRFQSIEYVESPLVDRVSLVITETGTMFLQVVNALA